MLKIIEDIKELSKTVDLGHMLESILIQSDVIDTEEEVIEFVKRFLADHESMARNILSVGDRDRYLWYTNIIENIRSLLPKEPLIIPVEGDKNGVADTTAEAN